MAIPRFENIDPNSSLALQINNIINLIIQEGDILILDQVFEIFYQYNLINPLYLSWTQTTREIMGTEIIPFSVGYSPVELI